MTSVKFKDDIKMSAFSAGLNNFTHFVCAPPFLCEYLREMELVDENGT